MEQESTASEVEQEVKKSNLFRVTPLSKYFAMILFILMPFLGGWIGYMYAPEKVVEVEEIVLREVARESNRSENSAGNIDWLTYRNDKFGFELLLQPEYEGYWVTENSNENENSLIFTISVDDERWLEDYFEVFVIKVFDADWWNQTVLIDERGWAFVAEYYQDEPSIGKVININDEYAFVLSRAQDCPGMFGGAESIGCKLRNNASLEEVMSTFRFIENQQFSN